MSYLHTPHLVFSGDFISDVSTVNNDPAHYNNSTFESSFQQFGTGSNNGWWNPEGGATFNFQNCHVTRIFLDNGTSQSNNSDDIVLTALVIGADGRNTGKMVDLDPQEQGTSELWAVKLRLTNANNELMLEGTIKTTAFRDLQKRQSAGGSVNGQALGGSWTSVIENIVWGDLSYQSAFLQKLKTTTQGNKLSLQLNGFGYYYNHATDGRFSLGRIIGSIGPWFEGEPDTFAPARRLYGVSGKPGSVFFSNSNFLFEKNNNRLTVDLGSSFPVIDSMGTVGLTKQLVMAVSNVPLTNSTSPVPVVVPAANMSMIGEVNYTADSTWLSESGGIITFDNIPEETATLLENNQLLLLTPDSAGNMVMLAREAISGILVRADNFVNRIDTNQTNAVDFYAYQFGVPLANNAIDITLEAPTPVTPVGPQNPICEIPGNNYPAEGISMASTITTNSYGKATLFITGNAIHNPRIYIDGQIYFIDYQLSNYAPDPAMGVYANDNVFVHLRDYFPVPENPLWSDISSIMEQFGNLYPIMSKYLFNFADPLALIAKKELLMFAFTRDINDPIYMPATRDLSESKRVTILKWLANPVIDEQLTAVSKTVSVAASPAPAGTTISPTLQRLKDAVRAKNGSLAPAPDITNLYEF